MQRITTLLEKISELVKLNEKAGIIDIDLMLDYTKVVYADLLEWRGRVSFNNSVQIVPEEKSVEAASPVQAVEKVIVAAPETKPAELPVIEDNTISTPTPEPAEKEVLPLAMPVNTNRPDINASIGINDKYLYISELFGNNKPVYEETLREINEMNSYEEAVNWLGETVVPENNWDKDNETVQAFYSTVNIFFASR